MTAALHEQPLGDERKYLKALVARYPGRIEFETGAGHILYDLLARLPTIPQLDTQKMAFCKRIADTVYPLAACLFAQSVHMTITTSDDVLLPPAVIEGLGTYTAFDAEHDVLRHGFLSAPEGVAYLEALAIPSGVGVLCEPLDLASQQFHDSARDPAHNPVDIIWQWTEKLVHAWYDMKSKQPFVPVRLRVAFGHVAQMQALAATDAASLTALSNASVATDVLPGRRVEPPRRITPAFVHEAAFAETAVQPDHVAGKKPQQRVGAEAKVEAKQEAGTVRELRVRPGDETPDAKHPDAHLHHPETPHPDVN